MCKKSESTQLLITKEEFVDVLDRLREATELVDNVNALFRKSREKVECDFCDGAALQISHEGIVINLLQKLMHDERGLIFYFIFELDYGRKQKEQGESPADISTAEKLYEYLASAYREKSIENFT